MSQLSRYAQVSFELIVIFGAVIGIVSIILASYVVIKDSTVALIIVKEKTIEKLSLDDFSAMVYIDQINFTETPPDTIEIDVTLSSNSAEMPPVFITEIQNEVRLRTKYDFVTITYGDS